MELTHLFEIWEDVYFRKDSGFFSSQRAPSR
jgi:hypothetical protein